MFLIEQNGAVAAIVLGKQGEVDNEELARVLSLFQKRLGEMVEHATHGDMAMTEDREQLFIRDEETGEFHEPPTTDNSGN